MKKIISCFIAGITMCGAVFAQDAMKPKGLMAFDKAPGFAAADQNGKTISLDALLKEGPVVLLFYRGQWCPYCNKQLKNLEDSLSFLKDKKVTVVAVTPETPENIKATAEKTKASFSLVYDEGMKIMKAYNVAFAVDTATVVKYKTYGIDFNKANGSNGANLPVPATYIIGQNGMIKSVFFDTDYRNRPSVKQLLENL